VRHRSIFKHVSSVGFAGFVGLSALTGCQDGDTELGDAFDRMGLFVGDPDAQGRFATRVWDMDDGTQKITHHLLGERHVDDVEIVLPEGVEVPERDAWVSVFGAENDEGAIVVDDFEVLPPPAHLIDPDPLAARRIALIIVYWTAQSLGNAQAREDLFLDSEGAPDSTNYYYQENSYGKEKMAGNVFGPYEVPNPGSCSPGLIADYADTAFAEKGHTEDNYIQFAYHFQGLNDCGFGGLANLGNPEFPARSSWYNGGFGCVVRNQELGHNYGMLHSNSFSCEDAEGNQVLYSDNCSSNEYGDPYDPMGHGCDHMNAMQKAYMDWIGDCNWVKATSPGTFNLLPLELPCNGTQMLQLPTFDGKFYFLEYRQPLGFDAGREGVLIHVGNEPGFSQNPNIIGDFYRAGDTYTDPGGSIEFTILEEHDTHAVIQVDFPNGGDGNEPTCDGGGAPVEDAGAWGVIECAPLIEADVTPPEVSITFPEEGQWFEPGSSFEILAEAADERGITELELFVNGDPHPLILIGEPWAWPVTNIPEGTYSIGARAWDGPNWTASDDNTPVTFHVGTPPMEDPETTGGDETGDGTMGMLDTGMVADSGDDDSDETETDDPGGTEPSGCACTTSDRTPAPLGLSLLVVGAAALRRRRRS
jgi:MYXO-CTERM domain-containing protein